MTAPPRPLLALLLSALLVLTARPAELPAQAADPGTARWRAAGLPDHKVNALAVAPDNPQLVYAVTGTGQDPDTQRIYRSGNGGGTWDDLYDEPQGDHNAVAIDPSDSNIVYVGESYEVLKTVNGGQRWDKLPAIGAAGHTAIVVNPTSTRTVYVGMEFGWGVFKTTNGGASWGNVLSSAFVNALALDPQSPDTLFAGTREYSTNSPNGRSGVLRTRNGGQSWTRVLTGTTVLSLLVDPRNSQVIYAGTGGDGVLKSSDGGDSWAPANAGLNHPVVQTLVMGPTSSQLLYAGTWEGGVYRSSDGGASWSPFGEGLTNPYVLALAVDPTDPNVLYAGTRGDGVFKYSGPPLPGPDKLYANVVDEAGAPVAGARIAHNGRLLSDSQGQPLVTDGAGNLVLSGVAPGDTLVALVQRHQQPTVRLGHAGWAYRVYASSLSISAAGEVSGLTVTASQGPQTMVVRATRPLVLFNLLVAVEWDAEPEYLAQVRAGMAAASNFLFDYTDGQMAFEQVAVADQAANWLDADIQIATANTVRPHAFVGGIRSADRAHVLRLGRGWDGSWGGRGPWNEASGFRTIAHEFGHYGLFLYDEYFGFTPDGSGGYGDERAASCTTPEQRAAVGEERAASVMDDQYRSSELSMRDLAPLWAPDCLNTAQWQRNNESAWETLARQFADSAATPRWRLTTPAQRGAVMPGPEALPANVLALPTFAPLPDPGGPPPRTLSVVDPAGQPVRGAIVSTQHPSGRMLGQGLSDNNGKIELLGAASGDLVRAISFDGGLFGKLPIDDARQLTLILTPVSNALAAGDARRPFLIVQPQSPTGGAVELLVSLQQHGADADPTLLFTAPDGVSSSAPLLSYSPTTGAYEARVSVPALERGTGRLRTDRRLGGERPVIQASYRLQYVRNTAEQVLFSDDGRLELQLPPGALYGNDSYVVVMPTGASPGAPPAGLALVGETYAVTASGSPGPLERQALLTLSFDGRMVSGLPPQDAAIYRWDTVTAEWRPLAGVLDEEHRSVSAPIQALGIYALLARDGAWTQPRQERIALPLLRR